MKKVELLEIQGIEVGDAIDMLFKFKEEVLILSNDFIDKKLERANRQKEELQKQMEELDEEIETINKLKDDSLGIEEKQEIMEKEYKEGKSYDAQVHDAKLQIKWARDFFKF